MAITTTTAVRSTCGGSAELITDNIIAPKRAPAPNPLTETDTVIEILPALPVEQKPIEPRDRIIDLVAMKQYAAHVGFPPGLDFWTRHDMAAAWAAQRDHEFDARRGGYFV